MQILHKAKRKDNGEWVEGYFYKINDMSFIFPALTNGSYDVSKHVMKFINPCYEVDEKTLCRFTGLQDKNKNKLWEHDIVVINGEDGYFHIVWEEDQAAYVLESETENIVVTFDNYWSYETECYGNFIDNPDLLFEEFEW